MIANTGLVKLQNTKMQGVFTASRMQKAITFALIVFIAFVWFFGNANAISVIVNAPNGGESWLQGTSHTIDFNVFNVGTQTDYNTTVTNAGLYYSTTAGTMTNAITTKKPLFVTINPDANSQGWNVGAGTDIKDYNTSGKKDGAGSLELKVLNGDSYNIQFKQVPATSLTDINANGGHISFWAMTNNRANLSSIRIYLKSATGTIAEKTAGQIPATNMVWEKFTLDLNALETADARFDINLFQIIQVGEYTSGSADVNIWIDGIRIYDNKNCIAFDGNQEANTNCTYSWTLPASGDLNNLYIDITAQDLNASRSNPTATDSSNDVFNFYGFRFKFYDEKSIATKVQPDTFTIDGNSWLSYCTSGSCTIPLGANISKTWHLFSAGKTGYGTRDFNIQVDINSTTDINAVLMPTTTGKTISFQFYAPNQTTLLSNYLVTPRFQNNQWAGAQTTDAQGKANFYLDANGAENYTFDLNNLTEGLTDYNYGTTRVTVLTPKDEKTFASITPYTLTVGNLAIGRDYNAVSASVDFNIFSNTTDYYKFRVDDANQGLWLARTLLVQTKGNTSTLLVEPFLPSSSEGIYSTILVYDATTKGFLPNVTVKIKRDINGSNQEIFSDITDLAGVVQPSLLYLRDYNAEFYNGTNLIFGGILNAVSNTYYVSLDLNFTGFDYNAPILLDINFNGSSVLECGSNGVCHFDQNITGADIASITYLITNGNKTIKSATYTSADANWSWQKPDLLAQNIYVKHFEQNFSTASIDENSDVTIKITVTKINGTTIVRWKAYGILEYGQTSLKASLQSLHDLFGDFGSQLLALFITICAVGGAVAIKPDAPSAATILGMVMLGGFTYVGWFNSTFYVFLCFAAFILYFYLRRETE